MAVHFILRRVFLLALLLVGFAGCRDSGSELKGSATVKEVHGEVKYRGGPVSVGQEIELDQPIEVAQGSAVLHIQNVGEVRLFAKTRVRMQAGSKLRLTLGKVWCLITELGSSPKVGFEVETDNAVAGVRGTQFVVSVTEEETEVAVLEGVVDVANAEQPKKITRLSARKRTRVKKKELPAPAEEFVPEEETATWQELQTELGVEPTPVEPAPEEEESGSLEDVKEELQEEAEAAKSKAKRKAEKAKSEAARQAEEARRQMEREAEETKAQLKKEADETKKQLKKESEDTKKQLDDEKKSALDEMRRQEEEMRRRMKDMGKGKSLKDF